MFDQDSRHGSSVKTGADFALEYLDLNKVFRPFVGRLPESGAVDRLESMVASQRVNRLSPCALQEGPHLLSIAVGFGIALMTPRLEPIGKHCFVVQLLPVSSRSARKRWPPVPRQRQQWRTVAPRGEFVILDTCRNNEFDGEGVPAFPQVLRERFPIFHQLRNKCGQRMAVMGRGSLF